MISRTAAVLVSGWLLALGACKDDTPAAGSEPAAGGSAGVGEPSNRAVDAAAESAGAEATCVDWSKKDLDDLPPLPSSEHAALLDRVWRLVAEKHYDPTLGCVDWLAVRRRYGAKLAKAEDTDAAYAVINDMLGELEQSHFRLFEPVGSQEQVGPATPPMQVRWIEDQLVVVEREAEAGAGKVPMGAVLESVDGKPVEDLIERAKTQTGTDEGSEFAFAVARAAMARLSCARPGRTKTLEVRAGEDESKTTSVEVTCEAPRGELVSLGNLSNVPTRVAHRMIDGTEVGYLAFNVWMLPMIQKVEAAMTDLRQQGMKALVLDLRGNPGGVGPMSVPVARLLLSKPGSLGKLQFREFAQEFNVEPAKDPFEGPVVLLVDEGTASTSEIFAAGLRDLKRVEVFGGRASAGAALPSVIEELEDGAVLQYVVGDYHSPGGTMVEGRGVIPDVVVPETREAFADGKDPVLQAAVEHLQARIGS